jgi:phosphatidylglycerophosphate synthase
MGFALGRRRQDVHGIRQLLESWSRNNAVLLLCALASALWLGKPWPIGVVAFGSFVALVVGARGAWTPAGRFGAANLVTALRLLLVGALSIALHQAAGGLLAALVLATLVLDGLDGWLARRAGLTSPFGAHFDMEVDALLVLTTSAELFLSGKFGWWILAGGVLRYLYVLCAALWPPRGGSTPRTLLGRSAFLLVVVGQALGLFWAGSAALLAAALGTLAVSLSFALSFFYGYARPAKPMSDS